MTTPPKPDVVSEERLQVLRNRCTKGLLIWTDFRDVDAALRELLAAREELAAMRGALAGHSDAYAKELAALNEQNGDLCKAVQRLTAERDGLRAALEKCQDEREALRDKVNELEAR